MFSKANIFCTIVTAIWGFAGGYLLWGVIGDPLMADHMGSAAGVIKEMPDMFHLGIGCLVQGFAFSTLYGKWANGSYHTAGGLNFGFWFAVLFGLGEGLINYATSNILDLTGTFLNALIYAVFFIFMGVLASLVFKNSAAR